MMDTWAEQHRQLRLFISSTFVDMNGERDALTRIFPQIKEICDRRGVEFIPLDLRWGITEEAAMEGRVIETCLREVEDARPFFIGIIGHRYGWSPQEIDLGEYAEDLKQRYPWLEQAINEHMSITEMEMHHAALMNMNDEKMNAAFYIRSDKMRVDQLFKEVPGSKAERKLEALKQKVRGQQRFVAHDYDSLDQLAEMVLKDVTQFVERAFPSVNISSFEQDAELQERILRSRSKSLIPLERYKLQIDAWLDKKIKRNMLITGQVGAGKSYQLAQVVQQLRKKGEKVVYVDYAELEVMRCLEYVTGEMLCQLGVKKRKQVEKEAMLGCLFFIIWNFVVFMLKSIFIIPLRAAFGSIDRLQQDYSDSMATLVNTLNSQTLVSQMKQLGKTLAKQPNVTLYLALDNLDGLSGEELQLFHLFDWTNQVRILSTASLNSKTYAFVQSMPNMEILELQNLNVFQAASYVNNYLALYGKMLDARGDQCGKLMRSGIAGNALLLNHILQLLVRFGSHEKLVNYIYELSSIKNESELYGLMLKHILAQFANAEQLKMAKHIIAGVAAIKEGLTESEIQEIFTPKPMDWSLLRPYLFSICKCKTKRWKPTTDTCRKVLQNALQDCYESAIEKLSVHFESSLKCCVLHTDKLGVVDNNKVMNDWQVLERQVEVLPELYYENERWQDLFYWVTYVRGESFIKEEQRIRYWKALYKAGYNMRTSGDLDVPPYMIRQIICIARVSIPNIQKHDCDAYIRRLRRDHDWIISKKSDKYAMFNRWSGVASFHRIGEDMVWVGKQLLETSNQEVKPGMQIVSEYEIMMGRKEWDKIIERAENEQLNDADRIFIDMFVTFAYSNKGDKNRAFELAKRNVKSVIRMGLEKEEEIFVIIALYADLSCEYGTDEDCNLALTLLEGHVGQPHTINMDTQNAMLLHHKLANLHLKLGHKEVAITHAKTLSRILTTINISTQMADKIIEAANKL